MSIEKIGFGGGCHWCTEAVFASLKGVAKVAQGWISSEAPKDVLSEAVVVHFDPAIISLEVLIDIHLHTHQSTANHSMRGKYRSAVYSFPKNHDRAGELLHQLSSQFDSPVITEVLPFVAFKDSPEQYQNYHQKNKGKPFCVTHIDPKLRMLMSEFKNHVSVTGL